jgi:hypothetical protein
MRDTISYHISRAEKLASKTVEQKAKAILRQHPNLKEFIMGNGSWYFTDKNRNVKHGDNIMGDGVKYTQGLQNFIERWDDILHITGEPMRFTATGKKITDW